MRAGAAQKRPMLVYGDPTRRERPSRRLDRIAGLLAAAREAAGLRRHEILVASLLDAGGLAQGIADLGFAARGEVDDLDPATIGALDLARAAAAAVRVSWQGGFAPAALPLEEAAAAAARLREHLPPGGISVREPEGFAHYALYPETCLEAVATVPDGPVCVIGLRSVGTSLAALVAAARPEVVLALTLRPVGHPFARRIAVSPALRDRLGAMTGPRFLIADEGPGLSGSSFAAAIDLLGDLGVPDDRIHLLPSHAGEPGPRGGPEVRRAWSRVARHVVAFEASFLASPCPARRPEGWCADLVGPPAGPLVEISGGGWRSPLRIPEAEWPPVHPWQERRKFLLRTESGTWLLKFAGLGEAGPDKLALAERLAEAGFGIRPAGLRHGFMISPWLADARPLRQGARPPGLVDRIGRYLGFRARLPAAEGSAGATVAELFAMLSHNAAEALGPEARAAAEPWRPRLEALAASWRPVMTDNRVQAWEWVEAGGKLLKTDAVDHGAGHDLVGQQDIAWDLAGAAVEFGLHGEELDRLVAITEQEAGRPVDPELVGFMLPAYCAFQLGSSTMAREGAPDGPERDRLSHSAVRYRTSLARHLGMRAL